LFSVDQTVNAKTAQNFQKVFYVTLNISFKRHSFKIYIAKQMWRFLKRMYITIKSYWQQITWRN